MRAFLDANILFSGSNPQSELFWFLGYLRQSHSLVCSGFVLAEAERNLVVKRPAWVDSFHEVKSDLEIVPESPLLVEVDLRDKDRPVLGAAFGGRCQFLLTGDKRDFGHLYGQSIEGVMVVDVITLAELV